jgi:hypothetical protein
MIARALFDRSVNCGSNRELTRNPIEFPRYAACFPPGKVWVGICRQIPSRLSGISI